MLYAQVDPVIISYWDVALHKYAVYMSVIDIAQVRKDLATRVQHSIVSSEIS